ncbi:MAG TPA: hypothetical protein VL022_05460 [Moheibacter sp.]|nr:hypothetical protein [Moheibacter sp.]
MNTAAKKISFIQEFLKIEDEDIITALENLLHQSIKESLPPMSLEQFNQEIDLAIEDEKNDRTINANELKLKIKKWS